MKTITIDGVIGRGENEISSTMIMEQLPTDGSPIHVRIHSEGGDVFEGFRIHDILASYPGQKRLTIESSAFSIASFIPMAFEDVEISPNGYMMIHPPRLNMDEATSADLDQKSGLLKQLEETMYSSYAIRTGKPIEEIRSICEKETFFNAEQCVTLGLANRITQTPVTGRVFAQTKNLPHGVVAALFGPAASGKKTKVESMTATVKQIKAAFPKAKSEFIVRCMQQEMAMEQVATEYSEELETENDTLSAKVRAMEEELAAMKASAMETEELARARAMVQEEEEKAKAMETEEKAKAKNGARPVSKGQSASAVVSAKVSWTNLVTAKVNSGIARKAAIMQIENEHPGLRSQMLEEVNQ